MADDSGNGDTQEGDDTPDNSRTETEAPPRSPSADRGTTTSLDLTEPNDQKIPADFDGGNGEGSPPSDGSLIDQATRGLLWTEAQQGRRRAAVAASLTGVAVVAGALGWVACTLPNWNQVLEMKAIQEPGVAIALLAAKAIIGIEALRADYTQLSRGVSDLSPALRNYMPQLIRLHRMIDEGEGESQEAEDLRDLMDESREELTNHEYGIARHAYLEGWDPGC